MSTGIIAIAAALAIAISTIGPAIGQGLTAAHAMDAIARQPEVAGTIRSNMIIAMGLLESLTIYGLLIAFLLIGFFVLLVVLKKLLFDPLVSFMAARDARIQDGISAGRTAQQQLDAAAQARSDAQRRQSAAADALLAEAKSASERKRAQTLQAAHQEAAQATRDVRARVRSEETAAAAAVDAKLPELVTALTGGLLGSDTAERSAAQIRQWVAPTHEG